MRPFRASAEAGLNPVRAKGEGICLNRRVLVSGSRRFLWTAVWRMIWGGAEAKRQLRAINYCSVQEEMMGVWTRIKADGGTFGII